MRRPARILAIAVVAACAHAADAPAASTLDVYPIAGTTTANPATQISFRGGTSVPGLTVTGSVSGRHSGRLAAHSDGHGVSFLPRRRFDPGELVTVRSRARLTGADSDGAVRFRILTRPRRDDRERLAEQEPSADPGGTPPGAQSFQTRPDLRPPNLEVTTQLAGASAEDIFLAPKAGPGQDGPMIRDASGRLVWFRPLPASASAYDFRAQSYRGRPVLTWWQGNVVDGRGRGYGVILGNSYRLLKKVQAGNGYRMDQHEFELTPRGTAYITAFEPVRWNLSSIDGPSDGFAWDAVVQEIDIKTGLVMFEWHSLAHVSIRLSVFPASQRGADPFHVNSIEPERKGRLLLSSRSTSTLFEIDRHTGRVWWRVGGSRSSFTEGPGTVTAGQHDARRQSDGTITAFDNGTFDYPPNQYSREARGIRLRVDSGARTVTLVSEYHHPGPDHIFSPSQGSMQVLPSGNVFLSWGGGHPDVTEFTPDGRPVFEAGMDPQGDDTYRAYRLPWRDARPARPPDVSASSGILSTDVYASWNGATDVALWQVLTGSDPHSLTPGETVARTDFETHINVVGLAPKYVQVRALDSSGHVLGTSAAIQPAGG